MAHFLPVYITILMVVVPGQTFSLKKELREDKNDKGSLWTLADQLFSDHSQMTREQACVCGLKGDKIVGGEETAKHEFPWIVAMFYNKQFRCGGSLINDRYVLTAAHCIHGLDKRYVTLVLGAHDLSSYERGRLRLGVSCIIPHPDYDASNHRNDLALLQLVRPVRFTSSILPVCLPSHADNRYDGRNVTVAGWGRTTEGGKVSSTLQKVSVPVVSWEACREAYPSYDIDCERMLCAGTDSGGQDSCQGDSGGPLLEKEQFHHVLVGIVSFGEGCARPGKPGVYARVDHSLDFVLNNTRDALYCPAYRG